MALCGICSTITFSSLPPPPIHHGLQRVADKDEMPMLSHIDSTVEALGLPWHENLDVLAASAKSCPLCGVVQQGVETWLHLYEDASKNNKSFAELRQKDIPIPTGQQLWLTKRFAGAPGFVVLASNKGSRPLVFLLAAVGFSIEAGSPWGQKFPQKTMDWYSGSSQSLKVAESWLTDCLKNHEECKGSGTTLPTRVLDISSPDHIIKLVDGNGRSAKYASLSYCWGRAVQFITNRENIKLRRSGFHISELTQTLLDAVVIARHLGLRYLWIDSLCILQGDAEDWVGESAKMLDVYSNAQIVIAANHADDSSVGCFHTRKPRPMTKIKYENEVTVQAALVFPGDELPWRAGEFKNEPLTKRGWSLQERVLAKRVLHYNTRQMYFECNNCIVSEDGCGFKDRFASLYNDSKIPVLDRSKWNNLIWAYGNRDFTNVTDRLPALSGLTNLFAEQLNLKYVAGLWSDALVTGMAWQSIGLRQPMSKPGGEYIGPSWSWVNYAGIAVGAKDDLKDIAEIKDWHVDVKTDANPYGEIQSAWITIRAPMTKLTISPIKTTEHEIRISRAGILPLPRMCTKYSNDETGQFVSLDDGGAKDSSEWREWDMELLILAGYPKEHDNGTSGDEFRMCYCMVVVKADDSPYTTHMKRVGWMFLREDEAVKVRVSDENWRMVTLL